MSHKKIFTKAIFVLVCFLIFFPLPSHAQFLETGPACNPGTVVDLSDSDQNSGTCPWCPSKLGSTKLRLNWELDSKDLPDPLCIVSCSNPDNRGCSGAWGKDSDGVNLTFSQAPLTSDWNLKTNDEIYMIDVRGGNEYTVKCSGRDSNGSVVDQDYMEGVLARVEDDCRVPCEVPFENITRALLSERVAPITEVNSLEWSQIQGQDFCYYSNGVCETNISASGDIRDIKDLMISLQLGADVSFDGGMYQNRSLFVLREAFKTGDIVPITIDGEIYEHSSYSEGFSIRHALIAYGLIEDGDKLTINIIDPNDPLKKDNILTCTKSDINPGYASVSCDKFYFGTKAFMDDIVLRVIRSDGQFPDYWGLKEKHDAFCLTNTNAGLCKGTAKERLLGEWLLSLKNISDPGFYDYSDGFCYAWVYIQTSLIYLGDFVGYDYHPNDGKYVGEDCDANHYPIQQKSNTFLKSLKRSVADPSTWLANVWPAWQGLFK